MVKGRKQAVSDIENIDEYTTDESLCQNSEDSDFSLNNSLTEFEKEIPNNNKSKRSLEPKINSSSDEDKSNYSDYDNESVCSGIKRAKELEIVTSNEKRIPPKIIVNNTYQGENDKSKSTRSQLEIYDHLLKCRMKLQPLLSAVNSLPQPLLFKQIENSENFEFSDRIETVRNKLIELADTSENIVKSISSRLFKEILTKNNDSDHSQKCSDDFLNTFHTKMVDCRADILQDWFDKTRLSVAKIPKKDFSNFEKSPVVQIEQIMSDPSRLVRRTHMNRSNCRVVGKSERDMTLNNVQDMKKDGTLYEYDPEIFDDSDFYQRQLSDFIKQKSDGSMDFTEIDKNRSQAQYKMDRPVDMRATKARKIRYTVIKKLAGLCAPVDTSTWVDESMNELFGSLFGKTLS